MKKMMASKSGKVFFTVLLGIFFIMALLPLAMNISFMNQGKFGKSIGESQLILLRTYEKGEKILYYIDQSAVHSLRQSLYNASQAGFSSGDCGTYDGHNLWNSETEECYPNLKEAVKESFMSEFKDYLGSYAAFPDIEYEFYFAEGDVIIGKAASELAMDVADGNATGIERVEHAEPENGTAQQSTGGGSGGGACTVGSRFRAIPLNPWPNYIIKAFGVPAPYQSGGIHTGIDIRNPLMNGQEPPIYAVDCGRIVYVGPLFLSGPNVGRGSKAIIIDHGNNVYSIYSHNSYVEPKIMNDMNSKGYSDVTAGQVIGRQGNEGYSSGSHVHFEVHTGVKFSGNWVTPWVGGRYEDPLAWLT
ncbi:TPA: M23 family metallopeptidase [Candidatus Woesearchaeota archaeon]|nr:Secreted peptidase [archaeon GW2011_AR15]MBS3103445.1 M23 family metallopeptidase [Candidatus Woesearchaeota archaeon]HIH41563.1 M23 family metallopeptidase [Candidatus Woesearchaeota archaeon]